MMTMSDCVDKTCFVDPFKEDQVYSIQSCISNVTHCYFSCIKHTHTLHDFGNDELLASRIEDLKRVGEIGATTSMVASCLFILISVYLRRYRRWIEQIILSKVVCDLVYGAVLLGQFESAWLDTKSNVSPKNFDKYRTLEHTIGLEVISLLGLTWIPILFFEVRNVIIYPFVGWDGAKLLKRWCMAITLSFAWACLMFNFVEYANMFQYTPIVYIGRNQRGGDTKANIALVVLFYLPVSIVFVVIVCAMVYVWPQLKGTVGSKDIARVKEKVLLIAGCYFGSFLLYFIALAISYVVGIRVHTCNPTHAPYCLSWTGWNCNDFKWDTALFNAQKAFLFLFCARGILDFVVFFFFSFRQIKARLRDKEYEGKNQDLSQKMELHEVYRKEIMNMIQIGIARSAVETEDVLEREQVSVSRHTSYASVQLVDADFTAIEDVDVSSKGDITVRVDSASASGALPSLPAAPINRLIRFQALAPKVFESIRRSASISASDYADTMNPSRTGVADENFNIEESQANVLIEKLSEGKGGAFFYFSQNYKFVIKTISDGEFNFMCSILKKMWNQMVRADTLLSRYFGVYTFLYRGADIKIVVMENVSYMFPRLPIHRKYDLKGSWVARRMMNANEQQELPTVVDKRTLKDLDMCYSVSVPSKTRKDLIHAIQKDIDFLAEAGIMDYSLFLSFHIKSANDSLGSERLDLSQAAPSSSSKPSLLRDRADSANDIMRGMFRDYQGGVFVHLNQIEPFEFLRRPDGRAVLRRESRPSRSSTLTKDSFPLVSVSEDESSASGLSKFDPNVPGKTRPSQYLDRTLEAIMYVGIIDFLQQWNLQKRAERNWKVYMRRVDPDGVSAMDTESYKKRFRYMVENLFKDN